MAALTVVRTFGAFALTDTNGISIDAVTDDLLHRTRWSDRLSGRGSNQLLDRYDGREVNLRGAIVGTDSGDARSKKDALLAALTNGENYLTWFSGRRLLCRLDGNVRVEDASGSAHSAYVWRATFRSRWPTWEGDTLTTDSFAVTTSPGTRVLPANNGAAPAWPFITITENGPGFQGKQIVLTNISNTAQFSIQGLALNSGQGIVVDMRERRLGDGVNVPIMPLEISGEWWEVNPGSAQTLQVAHNIGGGANLGIGIQWYEEFWDR